MKKLGIFILAFSFILLFAQEYKYDYKIPNDFPQIYSIDYQTRCDLNENERFNNFKNNILFPDEIGRIKYPFFYLKTSQTQGTGSKWQPIGPEGGEIMGLAFNLQNKNEIYALSGGNFSQLYKSTNSGRTWQRRAVLDAYCYDLTIDHLNPNIIYVLFGNGIFKSIDGGLNWEEYRFGDYWYGYNGQVCINPNNTNIIYASGRQVYNISSWKSCMAVYKSTDGGKNWVLRKFESSSEYGYARCIAIDPLNPNIIYTGGYYSDGNKTHGKLYKSSDGGENWEDITGPIEGYPESIVIDSSNPSKIYVGTYRGIYRSSNGGDTWHENDDYAYAYALAIDPFNSNILYAGAYGKCYKSIDGGVSWIGYTEGIYGSCNRILAISGFPTKIFYGSSIGIYKSDDRGVTWKESHSGIKAHEIWVLAVAPSSPNIIYASDNTLFKSSDFGNIWKILTDYPWFYSITVNPNDADDLFGVGYGGIYRSVDGGNSWTEIYDVYSGYDLVINKNNINHIFAAGRAKSGSNYPMALFKSTDSGTNWKTYNITSTDGYAYAVALDPNNDNIIYVGGYYYDNQGTRRGGLFKSINGGKDWINIGEEISRYIYDIAIDPILSNKIYIGTWSGIYKSEDYGSSWTHPSSYFDVECVKINPNSPNDVFAVGWDGVYFSNDGGRSWNEFNNGLVVTSVWCLDIDEKNEILYAGTGGGSIYKYNLFDLYTLKISKGSGGTTDPTPGSYHYEPGTMAKITAKPDTHYYFSHWSGDASGSSNPITITMDSNKSIKANFFKIFPPLNFSGKKVLNRSLLGTEYINILSWQSNPNNKEIVKYKIYQVEGENKSLLAELDADTFEYWHRKVEKNKLYTYAIVALNDKGREGEPAYATVN